MYNKSVLTQAKSGPIIYHEFTELTSPMGLWHKLISWTKMSPVNVNVNVKSSEGSRTANKNGPLPVAGGCHITCTFTVTVKFTGNFLVQEVINSLFYTILCFYARFLVELHFWKEKCTIYSCSKINFEFICLRLSRANFWLIIWIYVLKKTF